MEKQREMQHIGAMTQRSTQESQSQHCKEFSIIENIDNIEVNILN